MLKTSSLKLIAACVCPVVGTGVAVKTVPSVKRYVHQATAPKEEAKQYAAREPIQAVPCIPVGGTAISGGFDASAPFGAGSGGIPGGSGVVPGTVISRPGGPSNPGNPSTPGAVPEPDSWGMMILGFAIVGYSMRKVRIDIKNERSTFQ